MRRTLGVLVLATAIAAAFAAPASANLVDRVVGTWAGVLHQDGREQGTVRFAIRRTGSSSPVGTVRYTGLGGCAGRWVYLGRAGDALRFRELITRGASATCRGVGTVTLRVRQRTELSYRWTDGTLVSRAIVLR